MNILEKVKVTGQYSMRKIKDPKEKEKKGPGFFSKIIQSIVPGEEAKNDAKLMAKAVNGCECHSAC